MPHESGMVHRDIKPSNLMATWPATAGSPDAALLSSTAASRSIQVKILDLGLVREIDTSGAATPASLTQNGAIVGTPDFIAPEQALNSHQVDIRADLYSLGCTFYFLLAGHAPFPEGVRWKSCCGTSWTSRSPSSRRGRRSVRRWPASWASCWPSAPWTAIKRRARSLRRWRLIGRDRRATGVRPPAESQEPARATAPCPAVDAEGAAPALAASVYHWSGAREGPATEPIVPARRTKKIAVCDGHQSCVTAVAFAPHRETMASGDADGSVRLWEFSSKPPPARPRCAFMRGACTRWPSGADSRKLATGSGTWTGRSCSGT